MKIAEVQAKVEEIRGVAHDYEVAHEKEDELYESILRYLAKGGCPSIFHARNLALAALESKAIEFERYTA